ncbi:Serine/threonine-protein kinase-like protein CCR1 [Hibiscus syriacus]|uniref:non-specific serine/threonine protein kinase n=1 Tax=Hibiscus syriacus TaxID=106335 RepID=A0A6A2XGF9_HIBSY|nr:Serine/threonine-protein kinase-like protein CCR1 [Hibiscus syriacus]
MSVYSAVQGSRLPHVAPNEHIARDRRRALLLPSINTLAFNKIVSGEGFSCASAKGPICGIMELSGEVRCWGDSDSFSDPPIGLQLFFSTEAFQPWSVSFDFVPQGEFAFNASFFLSSPCTKNADRICTACSLCQNSSCWDVCGIPSSPDEHWHHMRRLVIIVEEGTKKKKFKSCIGKPDQLDGDTTADSFSPVSITPCPGTAQIFRLSELKDATNGFKEFNELGRGSYGFVYKAVLADGRQVPIKRPNAATIIHTNSREFEMELEILCSVRHCNIVNLLGYCSEKRERLLVYEYMPHGTLHDHLHGGLSSLSWSLRLKILLKAARGLKYLHKEVVPPIVHRDVKASNILLDSDWGARIAVFGLVTSSERDLDLNGDMKSDVYSFGIVLLEILTGRKAYNRDYTPASIVDWAVPLIKQGKAAVIVDRYAALPETSSLR